MSRLSAGTKSVQIGDDEYTLKVTIGAIQAIERRFGDFQKAAQKCMALGWTDAIFIVSKGAGLGKEGTQKLEENAVMEGLESVATIAAQYLGMIIDPSSNTEEDEPGES